MLLQNVKLTMAYGLVLVNVVELDLSTRMPKFLWKCRQLEIVSCFGLVNVNIILKDWTMHK